MCSNAAGAVWYVYKAYPKHLTDPWADATYVELVSAYDQNCGVSPMLTRITSQNEIPILDWFDRVGYTVVPDDHYAHALEIELPLIEPPQYMAYLTKRFTDLGGIIEQGEVNTFDELVADNRVIVNATGMGARELANDQKLKPMRGQVTLVKQLDTPLELGFMCDDDDLHPMYIFPRSGDIVLGGSADESDSTDIWDDLKTHILDSAFTQNSALRDALHLRDVVGFRPGREAVRLEREQLSDSCMLIHNYGHGGAGFTLCWGCADTVVELAKQV